MKLSLDDLSEKYDPEHVIQEPEIIYNRFLSKHVDTFIITAAQNSTPVEEKFWATLLKMAEIKGAEILISPVRYKNPTSQWSGSQRNAEHWDKLVRPYLWNRRFDINSNLSFLADIRVQPTASNPLSGIEGMAGAASSIMAHPRIQTKSVATPHSKMAKLLWTTGVCTVPNYTDSRVGRIGSSHHSISALIVEIVNGMFFIRRLHWDSVAESIIDLDKEFTTNGEKPAPVPLALILGDSHVGFVDPGVEKATFGKNGLVQLLKPQHLVFHDLLDTYSANPHEQGNPFSAIARNDSQMNDVAAEVGNAIDYVVSRTPPHTLPVIVDSNHNDMLSRWIKTNDWRSDAVNAEFYLETALEMVKATKMGPGGAEYPSAFAHWVRKNAPQIKVLDGGESFFLGDHELGLHGDKGPNGTRGSRKNLSRLGSKVIIGHSHSPGEEEGAIQTGTSTRLLLSYNRSAPSSWLNAHVILHANNYTQLIVMVDGKFQA